MIIFISGRESRMQLNGGVLLAAVLFGMIFLIGSILGIGFGLSGICRKVKSMRLKRKKKVDEENTDESLLEQSVSREATSSPEQSLSKKDIGGEENKEEAVEPEPEPPYVPGSDPNQVVFENIFKDMQNGICIKDDDIPIYASIADTLFEARGILNSHLCKGGMGGSIGNADMNKMQDVICKAQECMKHLKAAIIGGVTYSNEGYIEKLEAIKTGYEYYCYNRHHIFSTFVTHINVMIYRINSQGLATEKSDIEYVASCKRKINEEWVYPYRENTYADYIIMCDRLESLAYNRTPTMREEYVSEVGQLSR